MSMTPFLIPLVAIAYLFGRFHGEHRGIGLVFDGVCSTGRFFSGTDVIVGDVVSWGQYEKDQANSAGTVDGVAVDSRNANSKHEASVKISGTHNYRHPFLNCESDA